MIGEELRKLRKAKNLTQQQVEQICGIRQQHLTRIENNKIVPTYSTLFNLLSVYIDDVEHITDSYIFEMFKQSQDLKTDELYLLENYRGLNKKGKDMLLEISDDMANNTKYKE